MGHRRGAGPSALASLDAPGHAQAVKERAMNDTTDIIARATSNPHFREVLSTGPHSQVVVMMIPPGGEIGEETHDDVDQVLVITGGSADAVLEGTRRGVVAGHLVHVPAGTRHNLVNTGPEDLRLYTVYAPPQHAPGTVHHTRADADMAEAASAT
jgi:mannose-6-phosphate isomerase-like protein (cupin superfamily)